MRRVLVGAYACNPRLGSEAAVGWNVVLALGRKHQVTVITQAAHRSDIEVEMAKGNVPQGIAFRFVDLGGKFRALRRTRRGIQVHYVLWQIAATRLARQITAQADYDLYHHITLIQYRTISPGYFLDLPFLMGPVGGAELVPPELMSELGALSRVKELARRFLAPAEVAVLRALIASRRRRVMYLAANEMTLRRLRSLGAVDPAVVPAIGISGAELVKSRVGRSGAGPATEALELLYVGRAEDWKGLRLLMRALRIAMFRASRDIRLRIVGVRNAGARRRLEEYGKRVGLGACLEVVEHVERRQLWDMYAGADALCYPAFRDSGSLAVLESCARSKPVICLDVSSQAWLPNDCALKVTVSGDRRTRDVEIDYAAAIKWAAEHPDELAAVGARAAYYVESNMSWDSKARSISRAYEFLLGYTHDL